MRFYKYYIIYLYLRKKEQIKNIFWKWSHFTYNLSLNKIKLEYHIKIGKRISKPYRNEDGNNTLRTIKPLK